MHEEISMIRRVIKVLTLSYCREMPTIHYSARLMLLKSDHPLPDILSRDKGVKDASRGGGRGGVTNQPSNSFHPRGKGCHEE